MCKSANNILFCTCDFGDDYPEEYWVLYRLAKDKNMMIVGSLVMPEEHKGLFSFSKTSLFIRNALNAGGCFDKEIAFIAGDVISITLFGFQESFDFKYHGTRWRKYTTRNPWELQSKYDEFKKGTINSDQIPINI
jgi:hypothetical protein